MILVVVLHNCKMASESDYVMAEEVQYDVPRIQNLIDELALNLGIDSHTIVQRLMGEKDLLAFLGTMNPPPVMEHDVTPDPERTEADFQEAMRMHTVTYGKWKNHTLEQILQNDPEYIKWHLCNDRATREYKDTRAILRHHLTMVQLETDAPKQVVAKWSGKVIGRRVLMEARQSQNWASNEKAHITVESDIFQDMPCDNEKEKLLKEMLRVMQQQNKILMETQARSKAAGAKASTM